MKTILILVDFSESSLTTCKYALNLIGDDATRLFLFHIYPNQLMIADSSFPTGIDSESFINTEIIQGLRKQAELNMTKLVDDFKNLVPESFQNNNSVEYGISGGEPEFEIKNICENLNPDLVIMGTRGEGKKGFLEGSMAEKLMANINIQLIAVPESFKKLRLKNIMYALNYSDHDFQSIGALVDLFSHVEKEIFVIHIELSEKKAEEERMMEVLENSLRTAYPDIKFNFHLLNGADKSIALKDAIEVFQIDLISFISHKTNFFQNLFSRQIHKKDFFKLETPMLALHE